jgi:hypothetical protein
VREWEGVRFGWEIYWIDWLRPAGWDWEDVLKSWLRIMYCDWEGSCIARCVYHYRGGYLLVFIVGRRERACWAALLRMGGRQAVLRIWLAVCYLRCMDGEAYLFFLGLEYGHVSLRGECLGALRGAS